MPYFPIIEAPCCEGYTTLCNFPPNNWEDKQSVKRRVNVTWMSDDGWRSEQIADLAPEHSMTVGRAQIASLVPDDRLPFLSITSIKLPAVSDKLPRLDSSRIEVPVWRATIGLKAGKAGTSYQGEVDPFPESASLLTLCPFLQFGEGISNYLLLLNLEVSSGTRESKLEIYDSCSLKFHGEFQVKSNALSVVPLDGLGFGPEDLPMIVCRTMAGIPLYFSRTSDASYLSLEHTHPPASLVIHGKRWQAQKRLKELWFSRIG